MRILILGGTAFLSAELARQGLDAGHDVTCLARGTAAEPPSGVLWVRADREAGPEAYAGLDGGWDAVVDVTRDPAQAREALAALGSRSGHWSFVSSCSVYARHDQPGADESAALLAPLPPEQEASPETYGEAKSAIEKLTMDLAGEKSHIVRAGLIGGPGDSSDRYGYWPARLALGGDAVLVPDIPGDPVQVIDVRDLAAWILSAAGKGLTGAFNAVGEVVPFGEYIGECRKITGTAPEVVTAGTAWLESQGVNPWSGEDSLPLWLPPEHEGFMARSNAAALALGLRLRPWQETLRDTLADELARGLHRPRKAGLRPETEKKLLASLRPA
ncbi:Rossmann-fold NAD(P)-binding domain-containing protein [Arthrobacter cupressi]|uniref:Nucleoside-diphosphate-sugar epimerase n=1 Tax=Arthrobacter cupressi TaxID=1045773 RepID=A0A1G8XXY5_9MICC|nr:epimerase [Arthrobacter cupressi]NYD76394.1 nucleoside-diphosphate-sugar epimerase [Arthrobacter cupressi]SDJ94640.1 Nucleoside-diphosphate-sugar epimerase [Arthrobacter cupressi]